MENGTSTAQTIPARILIADDETYVRDTLQRTLNRDGFIVTETDTGLNALWMIEQQTFDLVLIDINLPDVTGVELISEIRQRAPDTVVIVLTGNTSLQTSVESLRHGAHDYLFKPCKPAHLRESIRSGLQARQQNIKERQLLTQLNHLTQSITDLTDQTDVSPIPSLKQVAPCLPQSPSRFLEHGRVMIDTLHHVITIDNYLLDVTTIEFDMMFYLVSNVPHVISPIELIGEVLGYRNDAEEAKHVARQYIYRLRQKIKETAQRDDVIRTVRGQGYTVNPRRQLV